MEKLLIHRLFPFQSSLKKQIKMAVVFGLFVFLFLAIFQPFGLQGYRSDYKFLQLAGYGLITTITMLSSHLLFTILFPKWYARASWTVGKNILYTLWVIFIIGTCNWVYSGLLGFWGFHFRGKPPYYSENLA